jgi:hypothetical protein
MSLSERLYARARTYCTGWARELMPSRRPALPVPGKKPLVYFKIPPLECQVKSYTKSAFLYGGLKYTARANVVEIKVDARG